jgi:CTP:molybdopterin cytidylyltransferase MocA
MIAAVVPAAGCGSRMGRPKLALPVDGRPMLERVIAALRSGGADPVIVVTGPHDPALPPLARAVGADVCELSFATPDMRATAERGLDWLEAHYHPSPDDGFLLTPGDLPFLDAAMVRTLCEQWPRRGPASILIPTFDGCRGHPALIAWRHVASLRSLPAEIGIDSYIRDHERDTQFISAAANCFADVDTAADLA